MLKKGWSSSSEFDTTGESYEQMIIRELTESKVFQSSQASLDAHQANSGLIEELVGKLTNALVATPALSRSQQETINQSTKGINGHPERVIFVWWG